MGVREGRYPARDRIWLGVNSVQPVSTAQPVDLAALRERVALLAEHDPELRWFSRPGDRPDRYVRADGPAAAAGFAADLVRELPEVEGRGGSPLEASMGALLSADDCLPRPAVYAGHGLMGHHFPHVFGDGLSAVTHLRRLLTGPEPAGPAAFPIPGVQGPLVHALRSRYLGGGWRQAPGRLRADLRLERHAPPAGEQSLPGGAPDLAWHPDPGSEPQTVQIVVRHVDAAAMDTIKDWRKAHAPGVSAAAIQMAALRRGLVGAGLIPAGDGMYVAFDLRQYLGGQNTGGNFIAVPYLRPGDPLDPASVNTAIKEATTSGVPLVGLARGVARASLHRNTALPQMRRPATRRDVAFSHMRVGGVLSPDLITGPDGRALVVAAAMPPSVGGLSFMITEAAGQAVVTVVFCSPFTPRAAVEQVTTDFADAPTALLPS